jgi:AraC-like DNA-binding protein
LDSLKSGLLTEPGIDCAASLMEHQRISDKAKALVIGIVHCDVWFIACEGADRVPGVPMADQEKVVVAAISPALDEHSRVAGTCRDSRDDITPKVLIKSITQMARHSAAKQACMAPHHLHRTFRTICGVTLHQRVVQLRLEHARRLLQETDLPIASICRRVAYSSVPSFTNLFKSCFGSSSSVLRSNRTLS